jgi:hypothetical protein
LSSSLLANSWNSAMVAQIFVVQPCSHRSGQGLSVGPRNAFRPWGPSQLGHGYFTVQDLRLMWPHLQTANVSASQIVVWCRIDPDEWVASSGVRPFPFAELAGRDRSR